MTVLVIVEVLSVQDMIALDSPPYAAAGRAEASTRSKAMPRATRSRRFMEIPPSFRSRQQSGFPIQGSVIKYAAPLQDTSALPPSAMAPLQIRKKVKYTDFIRTNFFQLVIFVSVYPI